MSWVFVYDSDRVLDEFSRDPENAASRRNPLAACLIARRVAHQTCLNWWLKMARESFIELTICHKKFGFVKAGSLTLQRGPTIVNRAEKIYPAEPGSPLQRNSSEFRDGMERASRFPRRTNQVISTTTITNTNRSKKIYG